MARRGNDIITAYAQRLREEKDRQTVTQRCQWCDDIKVGMLSDTREWFAHHLAEHHPEHQRRTRVVKRPFSMRTVSARSLEDNIAGARAQGGAGWLSEELGL